MSNISGHPFRWIHFTKRLSSNSYCRIMSDPFGFFSQVHRRIGYIDAIVMTGGVTGPSGQDNLTSPLAWLQPFGMAPSLHVLPNEHDEEHLPILKSPFRRSEPWWCRALCSEPDRLQDGGLMSFKRADDALTTLDYQLRKQGGVFCRLMVAVPPVNPQRAFANLGQCGLSPSCIMASGGSWDGLIAVVDSPSESLPSAGEVPRSGWAVHVQGSSICEIDENGNMRAWPIEKEEIQDIGRRPMKVGRMAPAASERSSSSDELRALLEESFPSDGRLHGFVLNHFPQVGRKFTNTMGRQRRLDFLLAIVPHERIRAAVMRGWLLPGELDGHDVHALLGPLCEPGRQSPLSAGQGGLLPFLVALLRQVRTLQSEQGEQGVAVHQRGVVVAKLGHLRLRSVRIKNPSETMIVSTIVNVQAWPEQIHAPQVWTLPRHGRETKPRRCIGNDNLFSAHGFNALHGARCNLAAVPGVDWAYVDPWVHCE